MLNFERQKFSPAKEAAYIAVTCALLLGSQYILSFVMGVEIVTVIFVCFATVFGIRRGIICALVFTLLRCFVFGFSPTVLVLYLAYYPFLTTVFGALGKIPPRVYQKLPLWFIIAVNAALLALSAVCAFSALLHLVKVSRLWQVTIEILLWVMSALFFALVAVIDVLFVLVQRAKEECRARMAAVLQTVLFAAAASFCTALFTLSDDVITPLMLGYSQLSAIAYFYGSFTAMLPQCVCAVVSVAVLFMPLTSVLRRAVR